MKNRVFNGALILAAFLITCLAVLGGVYFRDALTLTPGQISDRKIKATTRIENRVATERNRARAQEAADKMLPLLALDESVAATVAANLDGLYDKLSSIRRLYAEETARQIEEAERKAAAQAEAEEAARQAQAGDEEAEAGGDADAQEAPPEETEDGTEAMDADIHASLATFATFPLIFTESQQLHLVTMADADYLALFDAIQAVAATVLRQGVAELDSKTLLAVRDEFAKIDMDDDDAQEIGYEIVTAYLVSNIVTDVEATEREREKIAQDYEAVMIQQDQTIVDEGDPVTEEAYAIMEDLGLLNVSLGNKFIPMTGVFLLAAFLFLLAALYLYYFHKSLLRQRKEAFLLFTLYTLVLAIVWTLGDLQYPFLPLLVFPMLVSVLIDTRAAMVLSACLTFIAYFVVGGTVAYLLFFPAAGCMIALLARYTTERAKVFVVGFMVMVAQFALSFAVSLIIEKNHAFLIWRDIAATAGLAALNGMLTVIVCMGSLPFWEVFFGVVTPVKLLDLTNPTNPLLRRLTIEAPGTYHHSLIVANLAETAAYDIGANPNTARAGGYYHDIGKLKYPQYFIENLAGENPHDHLDPYNSVQIIVSHVAYGLTLAAEYKLPQFLRDIICEHHGTTLIQYFYSKAKNEGCEEAPDESKFRYPYTIPQTRESACVMLADVVEAAVRAMIPRVKSIDEVEEQISTLIRHKLFDGQLADSQLSIKDVAIIEKSFFRVLKGMYHERIPYPKVETP